MANQDEYKIQIEELEQKVKQQEKEKMKLTVQLILDGYCSITLYELQNMGLGYMQQLATALYEEKRQRNIQQNSKVNAKGMSFIRSDFGKLEDDIKQQVKEALDESFDYLDKIYTTY